MDKEINKALEIADEKLNVTGTSGQRQLTADYLDMDKGARVQETLDEANFARIAKRLSALAGGLLGGAAGAAGGYVANRFAFKGKALPAVTFGAVGGAAIGAISSYISARSAAREVFDEYAAESKGRSR